MSHYLRVFNFLWRAKRMEYTLTDIWKGQMCNAKLLKTMPGTLFLDKCQNLQEHDAKVFIIDTPDIAVFHVNIGLWCLHRNATNHPLTNVTFPSPPPPELSGVLHQCHVLAAEMVHFIHQMQYYITFEVRLKVAWVAVYGL